MKTKKPYIITLLIFLPFLLVLYMLIEPRWIQVVQTDFYDSDIPSAFDGKRAIFLSDIHVSQFLSRERLQSIVDRVNDMNPDIVFLGGDFIYHGDEFIAPCFEELGKLRAPLGVYAVTGNHDYWGSHTAVEEAIEREGIENLNNLGKWVKIGDQRIRIGGVGDLWEDAPDYKPAIEGSETNDFVVLISHNPDYSETLLENAIDLQISGHLHGGQITFFGLFAPYLPSYYGQKYRTGLINNGKTTVLVSNGIGVIGLPFRFGARPQINVITLRSQ